MFATSVHFHLNGKTGAYQNGLHSNGSLLALPTNIRLEMEVANTAAYYEMS
jgi:hypothetical protein